MAKIPTSFQAILWSQSVETLDLERDKAYIIHQVLRYGSFEQIQWLVRCYAVDTIRAVFLNHPIKIYHPASLNLVKNYLLDLEAQSIYENRYLKFTPRDFRSTTA